MKRIGVLISGVIALVVAGAAMTGTAYAEVTLHLSQKQLGKGDKVTFTINGTEKGATYILNVTAGDTVEKLASGTDADGGKVKDRFKVPDLGPSSYKVKLEVQVTQGGAIWLDSHRYKYSPEPTPAKTDTSTQSKPETTPQNQTNASPSPAPSPTRSSPSPLQTLSGSSNRSTSSPRRRSRSVGGVGIRVPKPAGSRSTTTPSPATPSTSTTPPTSSSSALQRPKADSGSGRQFAIPIGVVVAVGVLTLVALAGAEARLLRSPAEVGRTAREAEMARLRALERAAERAI